VSPLIFHPPPPFSISFLFHLSTSCLFTSSHLAFLSLGRSPFKIIIKLRDLLRRLQSVDSLSLSLWLTIYKKKEKNRQKLTVGKSTKEVCTWESEKDGEKEKRYAGGQVLLSLSSQLDPTWAVLITTTKKERERKKRTWEGRLCLSVSARVVFSPPLYPLARWQRTTHSGLEDEEWAQRRGRTESKGAKLPFVYQFFVMYSTSISFTSHKLALFHVLFTHKHKRVRKGRSLSRGEIYLSPCVRLLFFFSESIWVVLCESRWWWWWWAEGRHHLTSPCPSLTTRQSMEWMKPEGDVPSLFSSFSLPADCMGSISSHRINQSILSFFSFPLLTKFPRRTRVHSLTTKGTEKWVRENERTRKNESEKVSLSISQGILSFFLLLGLVLCELWDRVTLLSLFDCHRYK